MKKIILTVLATVLVAAVSLALADGSFVHFGTKPQVVVIQPGMSDWIACQNYLDIFPSRVEFQNGPLEWFFVDSGIVEYTYSIDIEVDYNLFLREAMVAEFYHPMRNRVVMPQYHTYDWEPDSLNQTDQRWLDAYIRSLHSVAYQHYTLVIDCEHRYYPEVVAAIVSGQPWSKTETTAYYVAEVTISPR